MYVINPLMPNPWEKYFFRKKRKFYVLFSYVFYNVTSYDVIHSSFLAIICKFFPFNGGSML